MDFEIPENTAVDPAYSYGKDLAPITFPSEKEVPPKRIHVRDDELDDDSTRNLSRPWLRSDNNSLRSPLSPSQRQRCRKLNLSLRTA